MEIVTGTGTIDDLDSYVEELQELGETHGATVQAFDGRYVAGRQHLERAVELARRAGRRGDRIARDESVEILLYAAGRRQINQALEMGVSEGTGPVVVVVVGGDESAAARAVKSRLDAGHSIDSFDQDRVCDFFDIGETERQATDATLEELVCERVALLVVEQ